VNGLTTATGQTNSFSELVFAFQITPPVVAIGIGFAVLMGFVGGLLPALRASRMPITTALREA
jgi:putative ABC transport system permease protein